MVSGLNQTGLVGFSIKKQKNIITEEEKQLKLIPTLSLMLVNRYHPLQT